MLRSLAEKRAPASKLKLLVKIFGKVRKCVRVFYRNYGKTFSEESLTTDDLLSILQYVISKANIANLDWQIALTEKLATQKQLTDFGGYCLMNLKAALETIKLK